MTAQVNAAMADSRSFCLKQGKVLWKKKPQERMRGSGRHEQTRRRTFLGIGVPGKNGSDTGLLKQKEGAVAGGPCPLASAVSPL